MRDVSETGLICTHGSEGALAKPGTVGRALPGVAIKILGEDGAELPSGEVGDIFVHSAAGANIYPAEIEAALPTIPAKATP